MFNNNNKIIKENKGKVMKQSEFQETVLTAIGKMNIEFEDFKTFVIEQFAEQRKFNESFSKRLDSIENRLDSVETRLTRLESFHEKDIKNYE